MLVTAVSKYVEAELDQQAHNKRPLAASVTALFLHALREAEKPARVAGALPRSDSLFASLFVHLC